MIRIRVFTLSLLILGVFHWSIPAQVAAGGTYTLKQSVIANGGTVSSGGSYSVVGTVGQQSAGTVSTTGSYSLADGFWHGLLAPTGALVSVSGRVLTADGRPVSRAIVVFTSSSGASRSGVSNSVGFYSIDGVEAGQAYLITASAKSYQFVPRALMVDDSLAALDLVLLG